MKEIETVLQDQKHAQILLTAFQTVLDNSTDMVFIKDLDLTYLAASMPFVRMVGKESVTDVIGHTDLEIFEDAALARRYVADDRRMLISGKNLPSFVEPLPDVEGRAHYGTTAKYILTDRTGTAIGLMGVTRDITKEILARENHQRELEYLFELPANTYAAIFIDITDWRIITERKHSVNGHVLPSYESLDALVSGVMDLVPDTSTTYHFFQNFSRQNLQAIYESGQRNLTMEYPRRMPDGTLRWSESEFVFMTDPDSSHLCTMLVVRDIDIQKQEEQQMRKAAKIDEMTGLLNRATTMKSIRDFLSDEGAHGVHALMIIDVDNFKEVNDTFGHRIGDQYLTRFAQAVKNCFRSSDIIGRIGGDEFFVLVKNIPSRSVIEEKADLLLQAMQTVGNFQGKVSISGSVGICLCDHGNYTLDQLYDQADQALYQAKRQGKNCVVFADKNSSE